MGHLGCLPASDRVRAGLARAKSGGSARHEGIGDLVKAVASEDIEEVEGVSFVGQDSFKSGYLAGKLISYGNKEESNVLIFKIINQSED